MALQLYHGAEVALHAQTEMEGPVLPFWTNCTARLSGYSPEGTDIGQRGWDPQLPSKAYLSWAWKDATAEGYKTQLDHVSDPGSATTCCCVFRVSSAKACFRKRKQLPQLNLI